MTIHPFEFVPGPARVVLLIVLLALTAWLATRAGGEGLGRKGIPGIVALEFAGTSTKAEAIVKTWASHRLVEAAITGVRWDYLFILAYSTLLALTCVMATGPVNRCGLPGTGFGIPLAWLQTVAGALDAVENVGLFQMLRGDHAAPVPLVTQWCATLKFAFVIAGAAFALLGLAIWLREKLCGG